MLKGSVLKIGFLEEIHAIGDNVTRFRALAILRSLYPSDEIIFFGRENFARLFFHSGVFDEFVNIDGWNLPEIWGGGFRYFACYGRISAQRNPATNRTI